MKNKRRIKRKKREGRKNKTTAAVVNCIYKNGESFGLYIYTSSTSEPNGLKIPSKESQQKNTLTGYYLATGRY